MSATEGQRNASGASSAIWICAVVAAGKQPEVKALFPTTVRKAATRKHDRLVLSNRIHCLLVWEKVKSPNIDRL